MKKRYAWNVYTEYVADIYIAFMAVVFVLAYHNKLFDVMETKRSLYLVGSMVFVGLETIGHVITFVKTEDKKHFFSLSPLKMAGILLCIIITAGVLASPDAKEAFLGKGDKMTGAAVYVLGIICAYYLCRYLKWNDSLTICFVLGCAIVYVLQFLNRMGVDPLHMYDNMSKGDVPVFMSTIGHINYNASFDCLTVGIVMSLFVLCREKISKIIYGIVAFLGMAGAICCSSDSVYIGLGVAFVIIAGYGAYNNEKIKSGWLLIVMFAAAAFSVLLGKKLAGDKCTGIWGFSSYLMGIKGIVILLAVCVATAVPVFLNSAGKIRIRPAVYWVLMGAGIAGIILIFVLAQMGNAALQAFVFNGDFAHNRGNIWKACLKLFADAPVKNKLLGFGCNSVSSAQVAVYGRHFTFTRQLVADAHNIYINTLLTNGIIGLFLWSAVFVMLIKKAFNSISDMKEALIVIVGIFAYLAQGVFNGPQILTSPIMLVEVGVFMAILKKSKNNEYR